MPTVVPCPNCARPVEWSDASPFRPFCSERCKLIDLGEWFNEEHRISEPTDAPSENPPPSDDSGSAH